MSTKSTVSRCVAVLTLVLVGALASSVLPAGARGGARFLKKSVYRAGEGIFTVSSDAAQQPPAIGPMASGPIDLGQLDTMASLPLPAGHFAIFAKAWVQRLDDTPEHVHCALVAENSADHSRTQSGAFDASLSLELAHTFAEPGSATVECAGDASGRTDLAQTNVQYVRIIAIRAPSLVG
jgi:hypothetical protein